MEQASQPRARDQRIVFANHKGGTGKTTSCISIAGFLAAAGHRVLVVDLEPQANATSGLGIDGTSLRGTMYDVVRGYCKGHAGVPLREVIVETAVENLHLAPSGLDLSVAEPLLCDAPDRAHVLAHSLDEVRSLYDYILIDTPPNVGWLMINGLCAAQQLVIPVDPSIYALEALESFGQFLIEIKHTLGHSFHQVTVVLVRCIKRSAIARLLHKDEASRQVARSLEKVSDRLFTIPESPQLFEAQCLGLPVSHSAPASAVASAYRQVANAVQGSVGP